MRVALFFDGKNFYSGWKHADQPRLNYRKLATWLTQFVDGSAFVGAHYYTGVETSRNELPSSQGNLARFLHQIEKKRGFFIHRFPRKEARQTCPNCEAETRFTQEKRVDTSLVADMIRLAAVDNYDIAVLLSGDEDLLPAVEAVKTFGKQVWVATWDGSGMSEHLPPATFDHINLSEGLRNFQYNAHSTPTVSKEGEPVPERSEDENVVDLYPEENAELQGFLQALDRAEDRFKRSRGSSGRSGFVGLGYFITKWDDEVLPDDNDTRRDLLDALVEKGRIEVYDSGTGFKALRINQTWAPPEVLLAEAVAFSDDGGDDDDLPLNGDDGYDDDEPITGEGDPVGSYTGEGESLEGV